MAHLVNQQGNRQYHIVQAEVQCNRHQDASVHRRHQIVGMPSLQGRYQVALFPTVKGTLGYELNDGAFRDLFGRVVLAVVNDFGDLIPVEVV